MKMRISILLVFALLLVSAGCKKSPTDEEQIRAAIQAHLSHTGTLNLQAFDTDVKQVTIQGDQAQAQVEFRVKNGPGSMQLTYQLEKRAGSWAVAQSKPVGSNFSHPALEPGQSPPAGGQTGTDTLPFDALRKRGETSGSPAKGLPPGHPPIGDAGKSTPGKSP